MAPKLYRRGKQASIPLSRDEGGRSDRELETERRVTLSCSLSSHKRPAGLSVNLILSQQELMSDLFFLGDTSRGGFTCS